MDLRVQLYCPVLTKSEIDLLHLVLGFVTDREAQSILNKINDYVSKEVYEGWSNVYYQVDTEDGLSITVNKE